MISFVVSVIGVDPNAEKEVVLARIETNKFDPDHLDAQVILALDRACGMVNGSSLDSLRSWAIEVSAVLTADEDIRPSLHLTSATLRSLAEAGAEFDFDPYI